MSAVSGDFFSSGHIPVNTLVALGTKTREARHRSLCDGCIWSKTDVSIENGRAIRIILHRPHASSSPAGGPLLDGDAINIFNVCGELSEAHALQASTEDDSLVWTSVAALPSAAATWRVCSSPSGAVATPPPPLEIMQPVFLFLNTRPLHKVVAVRKHALKFTLASIPGREGPGGAGAGTVKYEDSDSDTDTPFVTLKPVPFYFTTPHHLLEKKIPPFVHAWFPGFRTGNERWLNTWNQSTPYHEHHRKKWTAAVTARLSLKENAARLLSASESLQEQKKWTREAALAIAAASMYRGPEMTKVEWQRKTPDAILSAARHSQSYHPK